MGRADEILFTYFCVTFLSERSLGVWTRLVVKSNLMDVEIGDMFGKSNCS